MSNQIEILKYLYDSGKEFTFENFATKDYTGEYATEYHPDWLAWTTRVTSAIHTNFSRTSGPFRILQEATSVSLLRNGSNRFQSALMHYLSSLHEGVKVLEKDTFGELLARETAVAPQDLTNKVFIVHGHDEVAKNDLEILLKEMGLDPIVLHRQADEGQTIIEKFEAHADVGFAFILLTPDEIAYLAADANKLDDERAKEFRARPNVIWEFGYFVGRLTRKRTCCLYKGNVTLPSDLNGLVYKPFTKSVEEVGYAIRKELIAAGYKLA